MRSEGTLFWIGAFGVFSQGACSVPADVRTLGIVQGNTAFVLDLYARLARGDGNLFFSPFSISTAMAMTYAGARGETAEQISRTLHFVIPSDGFHQAYRDLLVEIDGRYSARAAPGESTDVQMATANALWCQLGEPLLPDFQRMIDVNYGGGLRCVDFRQAAEAARYDQHLGRAADSGQYPAFAQTRSSAIKCPVGLDQCDLHEGSLAEPVAPERTSPADFHLSNEESVPVELMNQTGRFRYCDDPSLQVVELPYTGNSLSLVVFLPRAVDGIEALERLLNPSKLDSWLNQLSATRVQVSLPCFKLRESCELAEPLANLGMPLAFEPGMPISRE